MFILIDTISYKSLHKWLGHEGIAVHRRTDDVV